MVLLTIQVTMYSQEEIEFLNKNVCKSLQFISNWFTLKNKSFLNTIYKIFTIFMIITFLNSKLTTRYIKNT